MWRRSLGGRAHPLAPALSAALQRLTGLTNLAVDGKFSYLAVVSGLTNLRQLASAAPMSKEGWQVGSTGLKGGGCGVWVDGVCLHELGTGWVGVRAGVGENEWFASCSACCA
jgi:hypothetical protein